MKRIFFDNASTTPIDEEVIEVMNEVLRNQFGNPSSIHHHGRHAKSIVEASRKTIANLLNASIGEIFFTSSATESNNLILKNCVEYLNVKRIISSPTEHHCVLHSLDYLAEHHGVEIIYLQVDAYGNINMEELENLLADNSQKALVSLMYGNNEIGTILDIEKVSELCKSKDVLFHSDAVQMIAKYPIDLDKLHISFLSGTAHKFHGPKGTGFFYMNMDNIIPPYMHGGAQERNMRAGTENTVGIAGMAKAMEVSLSNYEENIKHISKLRTAFKEKLQSNFVDIQFNGNQNEKFMHHILSVSFPPTDKADMLMFNLDIGGISASSGSACSSGIENDSHVLIATHNPPGRKTVRFSFSKYNTMEEVDIVVDKLSTMTPTIDG